MLIYPSISDERDSGQLITLDNNFSKYWDQVFHALTNLGAHVFDNFQEQQGFRFDGMNLVPFFLPSANGGRKVS